jgi:hypothetical protein
MAALILATLGLTSEASAEQPPMQIEQPLEWSERSELIFELRTPSFYPTDASFDALSDDDAYSGGMLGAGYDIGRLTVPGLRAYVLYFGGGTDKERFDGALDMSWSRNLFLAAADFGPELYDFFRPSARLGAGYALQWLEFSTTGSPREDYAHDLVGLGSLGFEFFTPEGFLGSVRLSFLGEVGYQAQTTATFDEFGADSGEDDPWQRQEASFGELSTNGLFWDLGIGVRIDL